MSCCTNPEMGSSYTASVTFALFKAAAHLLLQKERAWPELEAPPLLIRPLPLQGPSMFGFSTLQGICQLAHSWGGYFTEVLFKS